MIQLIEERPPLPTDLNNDDRQRIEILQKRLYYAQKEVDEFRHQTSSSLMNTEHILDNTDLLIKRIRDIEEQIRINMIQPTSDVGRLIIDCQVRFL